MTLELMVALETNALAIVKKARLLDGEIVGLGAPVALEDIVD